MNKLTDDDLIQKEIKKIMKEKKKYLAILSNNKSKWNYKKHILKRKSPYNDKLNQT